MNIAIYCGSSFGTNKIYEKEAIKMVNYIAKKKFNIVYGGSKSGLMGIISNHALKQGIKIYGVIPHMLVDKEIKNNNLKNIYEVETIRERKAKMEELSDAFIAYPGGYGTLEEISEILTLIQIGDSKKPCAFYNINGYYNKLIEFFETAQKDGFILKEHLDCLIVSDDIKEIITAFEKYQAPQSKWEILNKNH